MRRCWMSRLRGSMISLLECGGACWVLRFVVEGRECEEDSDPGREGWVSARGSWDGATAMAVGRVQYHPAPPKTALAAL